MKSPINDARGRQIDMEGRDIRWGNADTPTRLRFARHKTNTPERFVPITDELSATIEAWVGKMGVGPGRRVFAHLTAAVIRWVSSGVPIHRVKQWLGHATLA